MEQYFIFLLIHASAGAVALLSGIVELIINKQRIFQKLFLVSSIFSAFAGLAMIGGSTSGFSAQISFMTLGVLWLVFSYLLALNMFKENVERSRVWFFRTLALVLFFITMRIWKGIFITLGVTHTDAYSAAVWLGWVINLLVVEYVILKK